MKKRIAILASTAIIVCTAVLGIFIHKPMSSASALSANEINELCKEYTDTITPNGVNINDYVEEFKEYTEKRYETTWGYDLPTLPKGTYFQSNNTFTKSPSWGLRATIDGDDNITRIVPKVLFEEAGEKLYIGSAYGFFISTFQNQLGGTTYFESTVILIDVIKENQDDYGFSIKIQPMVQIDYCYATTNGQHILFKGYSDEDKYTSSCYIVFNNGVTNAVIPMIKNGLDYKHGGAEYYFMQHKESTSFDLSDISFVSRVYNNNALNYGDSGYVSNNDYGYFFNGNTYEYSGTLKKSNGSIETGVTKIGNDTIDTAIGLLDIEDRVAEVVGEELVSGLGKVFDVLGFIVRTTNTITSMYAEVEYNATNKNYYHPEQILPPNKLDQLAKYGELIKCSQMIINSNEDRLLFKSGDYAKGTFKLSHTDKPDGSKEYSSLFIDIAAKVVDNRVGHNSEVRCLIANTNIIEINEPEIKNINLFEKTDIYMLLGSRQKFNFNPQFTSDYIFSLILNTSAKIKVNGVEHSGTSFSVRLLANTNNTIEIYGNTNLAIGNITISPNSMQKIGNDYLPLEKIELNANGNYLLKIPDLKGVKTLSANYTDIKIEDIFKYENGNFVSYRPYFAGYNFTVADTISFPFSQQSDYYVLLRNNSATNLNATFSVSEVSEISLGQTSSLRLNQNYSFIKLSTNSNGTGQYTLSVINGGSAIFDYLVYDSNFNRVLNAGYQTSNGIYILSLNSNNTYYIGISNGIVANNAEVIINKNENAYMWEIVGPEGAQMVASSISLPQGYTYEIYFYINGVESSLQLKQEGGEGNYYGGYGLILSDNLLTIPSDAPIGGDGVTLTAMYSDVLGYLQTLRVIPLLNGTINLSITNGESLILNYSNVPANVTKFTYRIGTGSIDYMVGLGTTHNLLSNLTSSGNYSSPKNVTIILQSIYVKNASGQEVPCEPSTISSITFHNFFAGGAGTTDDPFTISSARHFNNIAKSTSSNYKLLSTIYLSSYTPIASFSGTLDGNGKTLSELKIEVAGSGSGNFGLFKEITSTGTVKNLYMSSVRISISDGTGSIFAGAVAGINKGKITNCQIYFATSYSTVYGFYCYRINSYMGGIAGDNSGTITSCINGEYLYGLGNMGGIAGKSSGTLSNCQSTHCISYQFTSKITSINDNKSIGGIVGHQTGGLIIDCIFKGYIESYNSGGNANYFQPCMGQIIGRKSGGTHAYSYYTNPLQGSVYLGNLSGNQALYAKNDHVGRND